MKNLHISPQLSLPVEAVTQKIAVLGMTGSGKSYCMTKLAELYLDARAQVVFLDPKGEAWGLRLMADGRTPAYPVPVFGGDHGDIPLKPDMGARVAELLVEGDYSAVLDVSEFVSSELARFGYDFATRLFELKKRKPGAMSLMIDEAQDFIPQNPNERGFEPKMLAAFERVGKQLRSKGVGMVIAGQRPQEINKKVLNMCEVWFAFQMTGLQERETMEKLIRDADREEASKLKEVLPTLEVGHAHVWSPRLLKVSETFLIGEKKTLDTSATPEVGARRVEPRRLSPVDIEGLRSSMEEIIEEAEANDPARLKREVARLGRELEQAKKSAPPAEVKTERVEVQVLHPDHCARLELALKHADEVVAKIDALAAGVVEDIQEAAGIVRDALGRAKQQLASPAPAVHGPRRDEHPAQHIRRVVENAKPVSTTDRAAAGDVKVSPTQQRILDALAFYESIGVKEPTNVQVGAVAMIDPSGGYFGNTVGPVSTAGLIDRLPGRLRLTAAGRALASVPENVGTLADYHDVLRARVLKLKQASPRTVDMLDAIIARGGGPLTTEEIGREVGIDHTGGYFGNTIGPLGTVGLIERERGVVRPTNILFPEGLR